MATIFIDNKPYEVPAGKNMLETCLSLGFDLPYFCWHPALGSVGACRQCAIKVYKDADDKKGRLIMSCMEPITDKQRISIADPEAKEFREHVIEWLMTNHPHDCAVCDEGGSCHLQDMTVMTGHNYRRFQYKKRTYQNQYLGPFVNHEMNRCIQCYRCVRFYKDHAGGTDLDAFASRNNVYFGRHEDGVLESEFSGNLTEICPTGVFTDKTLKEHYTRKWDLTMAPSICHHCSLGCNTIAGERYGELRVIMNRYHGEVNGYFLCDRGRFGHQHVGAPDRIRRARMAGADVDRQRALDEVARLCAAGSKVIGIGSPRASLQSNFALKTLVGKDNFYHGVSDEEHNLAELAIRILKDGSVEPATIKDVEHADAVLVLGEDLTNTAPRLALAVRQVGKQSFLPSINHLGVPSWNDAAVREIIQDKTGAVYIATLVATKLDDIATDFYRGAPDNLGRFGQAIAHLLEGTLPEVPGLDDETRAMVERIAVALLRADRPVIISGTSCVNESVMKAAANIAWALHKKNNHAKLAYTFSECNSMGLALMGGRRLDSAFDAVLNGHADTVIIMENDLYRHSRKDVADKALAHCKNVIVFDCLPNATVQKASLLVPAGTFAESDGTLVNNEGRAQRFFQVFEPGNDIQESWRSILNIGDLASHPKLMKWKNFEELTKALSEEEPMLAGVDQASPPANFRVAGQRIPREPHRYSGRTSMQANIQVSEPKPPEDHDSGLSYTMEGYRGQPPSSMIPFFWSPGWNSVQSVNKYQQEVGGPLRGGDPGVRMIHGSTGAQKFFTDIPEPFTSMSGRLWILPVHHIYGSDELSARSAVLIERIPKAYMLIAEASGIELDIREGELLSFEIAGRTYSLPLKFSTGLQKGVAALPQGIEGIPYVDLPAWALIKDHRTAEWATVNNNAKNKH
ncbi:MAG TPA: NADH-quinone oxidoreductase subunit NuoG [Chryseolinea sp.]|nr:NADH-quinone oxidoreductase subunit NuoG [Chryseolinea sp.]